MQAYCTICDDNYAKLRPDNVYCTPCGHIYHYECLKPWLEKSETCPECRGHVSKRRLIRLHFHVLNEKSMNEREDEAILKLGLDISKKEEELKQINLQKDAAESEIQIIREKMLATEKANMQRRILNLQEELKVSNKRLGELEELNKGEIFEKWTNAEKRIKSLEDDLVASRQKISSLEELRKAANEKIESLQNRVNVYEDYDRMNEVEDPDDIPGGWHWMFRGPNSVTSSTENSIIDSDDASFHDFGHDDMFDGYLTGEVYDFEFGPSDSDMEMSLSGSEPSITPSLDEIIGDIIVSNEPRFLNNTSYMTTVGPRFLVPVSSSGNRGISNGPSTSNSNNSARQTSSASNATGRNGRERNFGQSGRSSRGRGRSGTAAQLFPASEAGPPGVYFTSSRGQGGSWESRENRTEQPHSSLYSARLTLDAPSASNHQLELFSRIGFHCVYIVLNHSGFGAPYTCKLCRCQITGASNIQTHVRGHAHTHLHQQLVREKSYFGEVLEQIGEEIAYVRATELENDLFECLVCVTQFYGQVMLEHVHSSYHSQGKDVIANARPRV